MKNYLLILPVALLVTYSQVMMKWRSALAMSTTATGLSARLMAVLTDPLVLSAYAAALLASFAWLYVVTKLPLAIAFPVYVGLTFVLVIISSCVFLSESISVTRLVAIVLILSGVLIGTVNHA